MNVGIVPPGVLFSEAKPDAHNLSQSLISVSEARKVTSYRHASSVHIAVDLVICREASTLREVMLHVNYLCGAFSSWCFCLRLCVFVLLQEQHRFEVKLFLSFRGAIPYHTSHLLSHFLLRLPQFLFSVVMRANTTSRRHYTYRGMILIYGVVRSTLRARLIKSQK